MPMPGAAWKRKVCSAFPPPHFAFFGGEAEHRDSHNLLLVPNAEVVPRFGSWSSFQLAGLNCRKNGLVFSIA